MYVLFFVLQMKKTVTQRHCTCFKRSQIPGSRLPGICTGPSDNEKMHQAGWLTAGIYGRKDVENWKEEKHTDCFYMCC